MHGWLQLQKLVQECMPPTGFTQDASQAKAEAGPRRPRARRLRFITCTLLVSYVLPRVHTSTGHSASYTGGANHVSIINM